MIGGVSHRATVLVLVVIVAALAGCGAGAGYVRDDDSYSRRLSSTELRFLSELRNLDSSFSKVPDRDLLTAGRIACTDRRAGRSQDVQERDVQTALASNAHADAQAVVDASSELCPS
jgi:hypothetical protein